MSSIDSRYKNIATQTADSYAMHHQMAYDGHEKKFEIFFSICFLPNEHLKTISMVCVCVHVFHVSLLPCRNVLFNSNRFVVFGQMNCCDLSHVIAFQFHNFLNEISGMSSSSSASVEMYKTPKRKNIEM